jgi:hypothetical protein
MVTFTISYELFLLLATLILVNIGIQILAVKSWTLKYDIIPPVLLQSIIAFSIPLPLCLLSIYRHTKYQNSDKSDAQSLITPLELYLELVTYIVLWYSTLMTPPSSSTDSEYLRSSLACTSVVQISNKCCSRVAQGFIAISLLQSPFPTHINIFTFFFLMCLTSGYATPYPCLPLAFLLAFPTFCWFLLHY